MPLMMEHRILTERVVDTEEKWMNPGNTKKSSAKGKNNRQNGLQILKKKRQQQRPACQENEGD